MYVDINVLNHKMYKIYGTGHMVGHGPPRYSRAYAYEHYGIIIFVLIKIILLTIYLVAKDYLIHITEIIYSI